MDQITESSKAAITEAPSFVQRRSRKWPLWIGLLILVAAGAVVWWQRPQPELRPANDRRNAVPMSIVPATVEKGNINVILDALGTVTSIGTVTVRTQISGQLIKVAFKEGEDVKKGDLLAEIDSRPYEAVLAQTKGQLARDEAILKGAQVDLVRYRGLAAQKAVPSQTLDQQIALVAQYEGTVEADRAQVQSAEVNVQYCHILAPVDGRIGLRQVDQGNYITPGDANGIVVITQLEPISVLFTLPEDELAAIAKRLRAGAVLTVTAYDRAGANKIADGELQTFDSQIDATTGTIKLRAQFENENRSLYPNQFVNIRLLVDEHKDVAILPASAVQRGIPGTYVYLINSDDTVMVNKIVLGITEGERVEVLSGLSPGDRIVSDGADKLRDGAKIALRSENQPGAPAQPGPENAKAKRSGKGKAP